jgi:hypothetical protein
MREVLRRQSEEGRNERENGEEHVAEFLDGGFLVLGGMKLVFGCGGGLRLIGAGFPRAITGDHRDFLERDAGFFGDGLCAPEARRVREPFFAPLAPLERKHVELRKFEECRDGGTGIASGGYTPASAAYSKRREMTNGRAVMMPNITK